MSGDEPVRLKHERATSPALARALRALGQASDGQRLGRVAHRLDAVFAAAPQPPAAGALSGKLLIAGVLAAGFATLGWLDWHGREERAATSARSSAPTALGAVLAATPHSANAPMSVATAAGGSESPMPDANEGIGARRTSAADSSKAADPRDASSGVAVRCIPVADSHGFVGPRELSGRINARRTFAADSGKARAASTAEAMDRMLPARAAATRRDDGRTNALARADEARVTAEDPARVPIGLIDDPPAQAVTAAAPVSEPRAAAPSQPERSWSRPPPAAAAEADSDSSEAALLLDARKALVARPAIAARLLDLHAARFPDGQLAPEREVLRIEALRKLGRAAEAEQRVRAFEARYPDSIHLRRLELEHESR